jgi:uncharacterized membrane protein YqjE
MEEATASLRQLKTKSKSIARRLLTIGENRLELLTVEVQEERERLLHTFLLALGVATFGLLAGLTFTATIALLLWAWSPLTVLLTLTALYATTAVLLFQRLIALMRNWQTFPATLDQLRKDRAVLEKILV